MNQLCFQPFPELQTDRLLLRSLSPADRDALFLLRSDKSVVRYIGKHPARDVEVVGAFIYSVLENVRNNESILWVICRKESPLELIGTICLWNIRKEDDVAEIGYMLHPGSWKKGLMKEAIARVMRYGFDDLALHRIEAIVHAENRDSVTTLLSNGFIQEAHFRENMLFDGKFHDSLVFGLLNKA